ncbi:hypothetical protein [Promicromonospora sp. NPDC090134]|uniref:hypothetical protein n=1 Tax=Promicromonospora sp. NPDC090134 TaxID=3364408 RepID=UPI0037F48848
MAGVLYAQTYGKAVGPVPTLLADRASTPRQVPTEPPPATALAALRATRAGTVLGPGWSERERWTAAALEAVRVRRLTPVDRYVAHRAYPSPRGLFGADAHLVLADGVRTADAYAVALGVPARPADAPGADGADAPGADRAEAGWTTADAPHLLVTAHPERFPTPYGSLRPALAELEAGHLTAVLALTAHRAGLPVEVRLGPAPAGSGTRARSHDAGPGVVATLRARPGTGGQVGQAVWVGPGDVARLDALVAPGEPLTDWLDRRSSGSSFDNLVTIAPTPEADAVAVDAALRAALEAAARLAPPGGLRLFRHRLADGSLARSEVLPADGAPFEGPAGTLFSAPLGWSLVADVSAWTAAHAAAAPARLHAVLGFVAQWGALAAAARHVALRPARNHDDAAWAAALRLPLGHVVAYQLWARPLPDGGTPLSPLGMAVS